MNETIKDPIEAMLKENTGESLCDSGGIYGRHWEKNQNRDFKNEPELNIEPDYKRKASNGQPPYEIDKPVYFCSIEKSLYQLEHVIITLNLYHFLHAFLEYTDSAQFLTNHYNSYMELYGQDMMGYPQKFEEFVRMTDDNSAEKATSEFVYTYNVPDNILSQDIMFMEFSFKGKIYLIVSVHQGCDARGGFSDPYVFELKDQDGLELPTLYFNDGMFALQANEIPPAVDWSQSIFPYEEIDKLKMREVRSWESNDGGSRFEDNDTSGEKLFDELEVYYDPGDDTYYVDDTLFEIQFESLIDFV